MKTIDSRRLQALKIMVAQGADTEKKITDMSIDDIVMIDKIKAEEIRLIRQLQKDIKKRNVIGFLTGGTNDQVKGDSDGNDETAGSGDGAAEESGSGDTDEGTDTFGASGIYRSNA